MVIGPPRDGAYLCMALSPSQRLSYLLGSVILIHLNLEASRLSELHVAGEGTGLERDINSSARRRWQMELRH